MKRRIFAFALALSLAGGMLSLPASAASTSAALQTIQALGIMKGDPSGNLNLSRGVTRAEFAAMLASASSYKDSISGEGTGYSLFKDVKSSHWASEYIRLAVQEGWMVGYTDGSFRPDQQVKLEEACSAALKLLGYDASSLAGSFPSAQLSKASALGLRDQISRRQGEVLTRQDCVNLFYNLLTAQGGDGRVYAAALGYTVTNGEVDYAAVTLQNLSGPYVAQTGAEALPFTPGTVYINGTVSAGSELNQYDVYYYNEGLDTAWIYTDRVSGKISALSPSATAPTSVTISGISYQIGSSAAAYKLSTLGGAGVDSMATLLLGMDGQVVDVLTGTEVDMIYYGFVRSSAKTVNEEAAAVQTEVSVFCTDGITRTFTVDYETSFSEDSLVSVSITDSGITIKSASAKFSGGRVNKDATKLGSLTFASDVEILDTSDEGDAIVTDAARIAGCTLDSDDVLYYALNQDGEISHLILNDVTGDTWDYGYLISGERQNSGSGMDFTTTYTYMNNGSKTVQTFSSKAFGISERGGLGIHYSSDGSIKSMRELKSLRITQLGTTTAQAGNTKYTLAEEIEVYLLQSGIYYPTTVSAVNAADYTLTGWYDDSGCPAGGQIRVIIAAKR